MFLLSFAVGSQGDESCSLGLCLLPTLGLKNKTILAKIFNNSEA